MRTFGTASIAALVMAGAGLSGCQTILGIADDLPAGDDSEKLQTNDLGSGDDFGSAVAIDGDTMVVGASLEDPGNISDSGAAYVFVRSESRWVQQVKLVASDGAIFDVFGRSVAISGNTAVVGAPGADARAGAAYVFLRTGTTWAQQATLVAAPRAATNFFGTSVAIDGDRILVGEPTSSTAFVFDRDGSNWPRTAILKSGEGNTLFGESVALQGQTAIVGATKDSQAGALAGAAFVFVESGGEWTLQDTLTAGVGVRTDEFGSSVAIDGNTAIVGARFRDDAGDDSGAAYVFARAGDSWSQEATLLATEAQPADEFGTSVSLDGDLAVIGSPGGNVGADNAGAAYLFARDAGQWTQIQKFLAEEPGADDVCGTRVSLQGDTAILACPGDDDGAEDAGAVYSFSL